jgi:PAS domain S-box-containing protein
MRQGLIALTMPADFRSPASFARMAGVAAVYFVAGKIGLSLALIHPSASAIWAPSGIALAALVLMGVRLWPAIFVGAFLVNETTAGSLLTSLSIASGNTLEAVVGSYLVTRFAHGRTCFDQVGGIFKFAALAGLCSTTVSATIGVTSLSLAGFAPWAGYGSIWLTWWLGDATGVLVIAPPIVCWASDHSLADLRRRYLEAGALLLAVAATGIIVYFGLIPFPETGFPMWFLSIPVLLWAALRFGRREVAILLALLAATAIVAILRGHGSSPAVPENQLFLLLQVFMSVISVTMLAVATLFVERKQVEEALRRSEERYRILADTVPVIVFSTTGDGLGTYCNERWFEYTGMTPEASRDNGWISAVHPDDARMHEADWPRQLAQGEPFRLEVRLRRADGLYRWHAIRGVPWRDGRGDIARWIGTCTDIEDRKRADADRERLLSRERSTRIEAESVSSMLRRLQMVMDAALPEVGLEDLLRALLGRVRLALGSDTATVLLLDGGGQLLVPIVSDGLQAESGEAIQIPLNRGVAGRIAASDDGLIIDDLATVDVVNLFLKERVASIVGAPLRVDGRLIGVMHVGSLSLRHFTDDDLHLLRLVAHRAALAIERARLHETERAARVEAEAASRAKDEFLAMLSHELQTPLSVVLLWATLLRSGGLDQAGVARALDIIEQNARAQNQMIVDLLDVSRIVAGKLTLHPQRIDPAPVIETAIESLRPIAEAKGISISAQADSDIGVIVCDAQRLSQIISNLFGNAIKFTPNGGRVEIGLSRVGNQARLTVTDTGYGISREFLPHVFERFRQADTGLTRKHGGLGLGLAIVRHLVELHGGTVSASSDGEGKGAIFTVLLPVSGPGTASSLL